MNSIWQHRTELRLSQAGYARMLGVSQPYLSMLEQQKRRFSPRLQARLAEHFEPTRLPLDLVGPWLRLRLTSGVTRVACQ